MSGKKIISLDASIFIQKRKTNYPWSISLLMVGQQLNILDFVFVSLTFSHLSYFLLSQNNDYKNICGVYWKSSTISDDDHEEVFDI